MLRATQGWLGGSQVTRSPEHRKEEDVRQRFQGHQQGILVGIGVPRVVAGTAGHNGSRDLGRHCLLESAE